MVVKISVEKNVLKNFQMSEQNWGCLDKMSEVNFSPAETLNYFINQHTLMLGLIYFSISRIKAAKVSFNKRCHDLICNTI